MTKVLNSFFEASPLPLAFCPSQPKHSIEHEHRLAEQEQEQEKHPEQLNAPKCPGCGQSLMGTEGKKIGGQK